MAVTVGGTSITFNDGTTQSTAAGAVTTTSVLNAVAGQAIGAVGTVAVLLNWSTSDFQPNSTVAGSSLGRSTNQAAPFGAQNSSSTTLGTAQSGTWRALSFGRGRASFQDKGGTVYQYVPGLYLRIS